MTRSTGSCTPGSAVVQGNKVSKKYRGCGGRARGTRIRSGAKKSLFMSSKLLYRNIVAADFFDSASKYWFWDDVSEKSKITKTHREGVDSAAGVPECSPGCLVILAAALCICLSGKNIRLGLGARMLPNVSKKIQAFILDIFESRVFIEMSAKMVL